MVAQNVGSLLSALPAGWLADRLGRRKVLVIGFCVLALSNGILTFTSSVWVIFVSTFLLGAQIGISHSNLMAYLAETTPPHLRGTTFGVYHFVSGSAIFLGTSAVGCFWEAFSHAHGFGFSVVMVGLSIILAPLLLPKSLRSHSRVTQSKA
jgi:MFS family permease